MPPKRKVEIYSDSDAKRSKDSLVKSDVAIQDAPVGWKWNDTLLYWESANVRHSSKIASFDFDGCLAKTSLFKKGPDAWSLMFPTIPTKLRALHNDGYKIVIFTNQSDIGKMAKPETRAKAIAEKTGRLGAFAKQLGIPMQIFVATSKASDPDEYRKPAVGMWHYLTSSANGGLSVDLAASFFVGDAAGRAKDHGDSDKVFAQNVGVLFHTEEYFSR
eukprot:TRINITY_DN5461_c0_g1_i2.p2 TRINITY_DN5461_c0_g1~~TRINITY_DN5461_c0_g1_i2.p2  ORF type:complete len:232 (+),score=10.17 TRINITY_DN5461_c0_g1_i2:46-696(+)